MQKPENVSCEDVTILHPYCALKPTVYTHYGCTINPCPTRLMNRRRYGNYSLEQQEKMLARMLNCICASAPEEIVLVEYQFEVCPNLKQKHLHALIEMTDLGCSLFCAFWEKRLKNKSSSVYEEWRSIDVTPIWDEPGWLEYIRKDQ